MSEIRIDFLDINDLSASFEDIEKYSSIETLKNRYVYGKVYDNGSLAKIKKMIEITRNVRINIPIN